MFVDLCQMPIGAFILYQPSVILTVPSRSDGLLLFVWWLGFFLCNLSFI